MIGTLILSSLTFYIIIKKKVENEHKNCCLKTKIIVDELYGKSNITVKDGLCLKCPYCYPAIADPMFCPYKEMEKIIKKLAKKPQLYIKKQINCSHISKFKIKRII